MGIFYGLLAALDWVVYKFAAAAIRVIFDVAEAKIFLEEDIKAVASRIYLVLGVLILFEIVVSAIQYLVNPDGFDDKEKGFSGLLKKTVITIVLIVIVPTIFNFAISIQSAIVKAVPAVILGSEAAQSTNTDNIGEELSFTVLSSFVRSRNKGSSIGSNPSNTIHDIDSFTANVTKGCPTLFGNMDNCHFDYMIIVSTLCGGFLCYILLSMALDVAVRTIKLGIIQMLAPIPISTYIFGKDRFNKFVKMSLQVYADLFIRMAIVYLIIFVVQLLTKRVLAVTGVASNFGEWLRMSLVNVLLILGVLMFAKSAPKFLSDLLGLPEITGGDMADMFKPAWQRVGGFAAPASAIGAYRNAREYGEGRGLAWRRALSAGAHASIARLRDVASGKSLDESYKSSKEAAMARTNRNLEYRNRYPNRAERTHQIWQERFDNYTGVTTGAKKASTEISAANMAMDVKKHGWGRAEVKSLESPGKFTSEYIDSATGKRMGLSEALYLEKAYAADPTLGTAAERRWLIDNMQEIKNQANREYIMNAFHDIDHGDGETRNVFREDILKLMRSGADKATLGELLNQTVKDRDDDGHETGNKVTYNISDLLRKVDAAVANPTDPSKQLSKKEAYALADIIQNINKSAGNVRYKATQKQTSEPKSSS